LGINGQHIANPIKVEELPHQVGLGYARKEVREFSKVSEFFDTLLRKENDGKASPSSQVSSHYRERDRESSHRQDDMRNNKGR